MTLFCDKVLLFLICLFFIHTLCAFIYKLEYGATIPDQCDYYNNKKLKLLFYTEHTTPPLFFCNLGEFEVDCKKTTGQNKCHSRPSRT